MPILTARQTRRVARATIASERRIRSQRTHRARWIGKSSKAEWQWFQLSLPLLPGDSTSACPATFDNRTGHYTFGDEITIYDFTGQHWGLWDEFVMARPLYTDIGPTWEVCSSGAAIYKGVTTESVYGGNACQVLANGGDVSVLIDGELVDHEIQIPQGTAILFFCNVLSSVWQIVIQAQTNCPV